MSLGKNFILFCTLLTTLFLSTTTQARLMTEKAPASEDAPLDIISSVPTNVFLATTGDYQDRFIFTFSGSTLTIIDTLTWSTFHTQPESFSSTIVDVGLLSNGTSVIVALSNGNLARIELDDLDTFEDTYEADDEDDDDSHDDDDDDSTSEPTDTREIYSAQNMTSPGITHMAIDSNSNTSRVYLLNSDDGYYYEFNVGNNNLGVEVFFGDDDDSDDEESSSSSTSYTTKDIIFANPSTGDKIIVTTDSGTVLVFSQGSESFDEIDLDVRDDDEDDPNLTEMTLSDDEKHVFILDETNDVVWVFAVQGENFVDQISDEPGTDPIEFDNDDNIDFSDLVVFEDTVEDDITLYISGDEGLSLANATSPGTSSTNKNIDLDEDTSSSDDPLALSGTPEFVFASSEDDAYIYTINSNTEISVISDKPWVTFTEASSTSVTADESEFTITFQAEEAGTYTVKVNPNPDGSGGSTLIEETDLDDADTDTTTSSIDINDFSRATFDEGQNAIVVFVDGDSSGLTGRGGTYVNVDRPPGTLTITDGDFGNEKAFLTFEPSEDNDIANYIIYAEPAIVQSSPACPGTITFDSSDTITENFDPDDCSDSSCPGVIDGLTNGTIYCLAIRAVDEADQEGALTEYETPILPERTVGPAGFLGESGCSLNTKNSHFPLSLFLILGFNTLVWISFRISKKPFQILSALIVLLTLTQTSFADYDKTIHTTFVEERTPKHFTIEARASSWIPTNSQMKDFFPVCCNPTADIEIGLLFKDRYNITFSTGFSYYRGDAVGINSGVRSGERFSLITIPLRLDFVYRMDFKKEQFLVPFIRAGFDSVIFNEFGSGTTLWGNKFGVHAAGGVAFLLDRVDNLSTSLENDMGINDVYLVLEGRYSYINNFGSGGLDLSGFYPYIGVMLSF